MKRLFGTDGIRAVAGVPPLDAPTVRKFGMALADVLDETLDRPCRVVLGRDTRESGPWLRDAVAAGLAARGGAAVDSGVITTPGLAAVLRQGGFDAGIMISASHNPFRDNGLKAFGGDGMKLSDEQEIHIEERILDSGNADPGVAPGPPPVDLELARHYVEALEAAIGDSSRFAGMRVCLDCANGAASELAPEVFRYFGADVTVIGADPDGRNINLDCGSLHLDRLGQLVREGRYDVGLAFDGDADRCLAVDGQGRVVDGDYILYITSRALHRKGKLEGAGVVATIMSNFWLEEALGREGIRMLRAPVGDKYVLQRMLAEGLSLGGEQSGHVIFLDHATTGDGMLTGLLLLDSIKAGDESLEALVDKIEPCPQVLLNVRVTDKPDLREHAHIGPAVAEIEQALNGAGRVVLRYSGTEPLARVMIEGRDAGAVQAYAERLAGLIDDAIGES